VLLSSQIKALPTEGDLSQALASPGAGHRALIVLGIVGGIIALTIVTAFWGKFGDGILGGIDSAGRIIVPAITIGGAVATVIGFILGIAPLLVAGITSFLLGAIIWGLAGNL
jgi:hypothetical protein